MRRCMDLQLMDYRNSSKCASANPSACFRNAAPSGVTCASVNTGRRRCRKVIYVPGVTVTSHTCSPLLARCLAPPPLMMTSTRTPLCIRPSRVLEICLPAASSVSSLHWTGPYWEKSSASGGWTGYENKTINYENWVCKGIALIQFLLLVI